MHGLYFVPLILSPACNDLDELPPAEDRVRGGAGERDSNEVSLVSLTKYPQKRETQARPPRMPASAEMRRPALPAK